MGKRKHYWIWGPPGKGKTFLFGRALTATYRVKFIEFGVDDYSKLFEGTQAIVYDAIRPDHCPPLSLIEKLCDGTKELRIKYLGGRVLDNIFVIILSNFAMNDVYPMDNVGMMSARFNEIDLNTV